MNQETQLKLQAFLDGELSGRDQRTTANMIEQDAESRSLYAELRLVKELCKVGEPALKVPETREFYWSKIERAIIRDSVRAESPSRAKTHSWWYRWAAPLAGAAVLVAAVLTTLKLTTPPASVNYLHEIETPLEDTSAISFHSQSAGMTVVWVQSQSN